MQTLGSEILRSFQTAEKIVGTNASLDTKLYSLLYIVQERLHVPYIAVLLNPCYFQKNAPFLIHPADAPAHKKGIYLMSAPSEKINELSSQGRKLFSTQQELASALQNISLDSEHASMTFLMPLRRENEVYGVVCLQRDPQFSEEELTMLSVFTDQIINVIYVNTLNQKEQDRIFDSAETGLLLLNDMGTILKANEKIASMLGYIPEDMVGVSPDSYMRKEESRQFTKEIQSLLAHTLGNISVNHHFLHKGGSHVPIEGVLHPHPELPWIYYTLDSSSDDAQYLKQYYETIIQTTENIIFILDIHGRFLFINRKAREVMGDDVIGKSYIDLIVPSYRDLVKKEFNKRLQGIISAPYHIQVFGKHNRNIWLEISGTPLFHQGKIVGTCGSARDITEKMQLEDQRHHLTVISNDILQRKNLDEILHTVAQAIRNYCGFRRVIISLLNEGFHASNVAFAGLTEEEKTCALQRHLSPDQRKSILSDAFKISQSYYIRHDQVPWNQLGVESKLDPELMQDWHPDDFLFIPLYGAQKRVIGLISVDDPSDGKAPTEDSLAPVELFATQAAIAIENARLYGQISQYAELLESKVVERTYKREALLETNYRLRETTSWEKGMQIIIEGISKGFGFENAEIFLINETRNLLENIAVLGSDKKEDISLDDLDYVAVQCVNEKIPINISQASNNPRVIKQIEPVLESFAWVPILTQDEVLGVISVFNGTTGVPVSHEELDDLLLFANQAAHFVESTRFDINPAVEKTLKSEMKYSLDVGESYLIESPQSDESFDIFLDCVTHGIQGFSICRTHPKKIKRNYGLRKTPVVWLSTSGAENTIDPKDLAKINHIINEFLKKASDSVVLLEGIEYLIIQNDFERVIKTIHSLNDYITISNSRLLVPVNPKTLSEKELSILEKEFHLFK